MAMDESLNSKDTAEMRLRRALPTSLRADQGILTLHLGPLVDQHKVAGGCVLAFGKSWTVLLSLMMVCRRDK